MVWLAFWYEVREQSLSVYLTSWCTSSSCAACGVARRSNARFSSTSMCWKPCLACRGATVEIQRQKHDFYPEQMNLTLESFQRPHPFFFSAFRLESTLFPLHTGWTNEYYNRNLWPHTGALHMWMENELMQLKAPGLAGKNQLWIYHKVLK